MVSRIEAGTAAYKPLYPLELKLADKIRIIAREIYHASDIAVSDAVARKLATFEDAGFRNIPVCIAKTQYSFTSDSYGDGRAEWACASRARSAAVGGSRLRRGDLRRHHDHAWPASGARC